MKKGNRIRALFWAMVLAVSVTACKKEVDPLEAAQKNLEKVSSMEAIMEMEMGIDMEAYGVTQSMELNTTMNMTAFYDPAILMKTDITMDINMGVLGQYSQDVNIYMETEEDGSYMVYTFDGASWTAEEVPAEDVIQYDASGDMAASLSSSYNYQAQGIEELDGANAYKYSGRITGEDMREVLRSTGMLNQLEQMGFDADDLELITDNLGDIPVDLWIDESTLYPVKYEMDMTAVLDALMTAMMESFGGLEEGVSISVPKAAVSMTCYHYNAAAAFEIPAEAKGN